MTCPEEHKSGLSAAGIGDMLKSYLLPLLFGARMRGPESLVRGRLAPVSHHGPHSLRIAPEAGGRSFYTLERKAPFTEEERAFVERVMAGMQPPGRDRAWDYAQINRAVEWAIAQRISSEYAATLYEVFQMYKEWSAPENRGGSHSCGVYFTRSKGAGGNCFSLRGEACLKAIGVSPGTLLALGRSGDILAVENIPPLPADQRRIQRLAAPLAHAGLALWSSRRKAAAHLCPDGRILLFAGKRLLFMRRDSYWRSFPHSLAGIDELLPRDVPLMNPELRRAVYLTCLDLSFSGRRACLGILPEGRSPSAPEERSPSAPGEPGEKEVPAERGDTDFESLCAGALFSSASLGNGGKLMAGLVKDKKFQDLPRIFRLEMSTMDGPLILDAQGRILGAGAGFKSGLAPGAQQEESVAARRFGDRGMGVAVSESGAVEVFGAHYGPERRACC